ncbi:MAG: translation elongation factor EF-P, partial [Planctomycetota bacterium]|nr:translation elongation factor EF-P [Planctomycetota bacterium]
MQAKEIKNGSVLNYNDAPTIIESISVQSPSARGAATLYKFRGRNLVTKQKVDITLKGGESLEEADFERRSVSLMYSDGTEIHFLDSSDYNQYSIPVEDIAHEMQYVTE